MTPKDGSRSDSESADWRDWVRSLVREMRMAYWRSDSGSTGWPDGAHPPAAERLNVTGRLPPSACW